MIVLSAPQEAIIRTLTAAGRAMTAEELSEATGWTLGVVRENLRDWCIDRYVERLYVIRPAANEVG